MSSKRAIRRKACEGKVRHPSRVEADAALVLLRSRRRFALKMHAYKCAFCGGYHLGHPPRKKRTRRAQFP